MKRITKKLFSLVVVAAVVLSNFLSLMSIAKVYAEGAITDVTFQLDNGTVSGGIITFDVEGTEVTAIASGTGYSFNGDNLVVDYAEINNVKLTFDDNFDRGRMIVQLHDGRVFAVSEDNEITFSGMSFEDDNMPHLSVILTGGGDEPGEPGHEEEQRATATINYQITGAIEYSEGGGFDHGISFKINGTRYIIDESRAEWSEGPMYERDDSGQLIVGDDDEPIAVKDPETMEPLTERTGLLVQGDSLSYDYDGESETVDFSFTMAPGTLITGIVINGQRIENLPSTREELGAHYVDHYLEIAVEDIEKAEVYDVEVEARYPTKDEQFLGNFLWDYNPAGYTGPDDKVLNATMRFVRAEYDGHTYETEDEVNGLGWVFIWRDAERKKVYTDEREGVGEAQFPAGTMLTLKIVPDAGYQLVDFGINGGVFEAQDEIGVYTFEVQGGPFHLQATVQQVEDVVKTTAEKIKSGSIVLGGEESMAVGTARLDVSDIELTSEQISNFEEAAGEFEISKYVDISLYNTVYKGTAAESWDTQVRDVQNEATITLKLEEGVDGEEVVIVHETHDGEYEIIPVEYDAESGTITFRTKSFSNYAIATKAAEVNPQTYDGIAVWRGVFVMALFGLGVSLVGLREAKAE